MSRNGRRHDRLGIALVAVQFVLIAAVCVWPGGWGGTTARSMLVAAPLVALAAVVVIASAVALGSSLTALPEPNGGGLRVHGTYRLVRHPMYTGVLLGCAGVATARGVLGAWLAVGLLMGLFEVKSRREERFLAQTYPDYGDYALRTGKYLPRWGVR